MAHNNRQLNPRRILLFLFLLSLATTTTSSPYSFLSSICQLRKLSRADSEMERASLIAKNYGAYFRIAKSVLRRFVKVFSKSGAMKEVVETVEREVVDGGLLRDCLELGSNDLKGLVQIASDLVSQFYSSKGHYSEL